MPQVFNAQAIIPITERIIKPGINAEKERDTEHVVAKAGMDIGDTFIGQHIKHVQIPVRLDIKEIGGAHVTFVRSRPKLIGGPRAEYPEN